MATRPGGMPAFSPASGGSVGASFRHRPVRVTPALSRPSRVMSREGEGAGQERAELMVAGASLCNRPARAWREAYRDGSRA